MMDDERRSLLSSQDDVSVPVKSNGVVEVPLRRSFRKWMTIMCTFLLIVAFATQSSMSSAIVCMIPAQTANGTDVLPAVSASTNVNDSIMATTSPAINGTTESEWKFHWSKDSQGWVLSSFFIGYYLSQFPSGIAATRWGPKVVLVVGLLLTSIFQILVVPAAYYGLPYVYADRAVVGVIDGFLYAPTFALIGKWVPKHEISFMLGIVGSGIELGNMIAFLISTFACEVDFQGGWPILFYTLAALGFVTMLCVGFFASDSPFSNKYISKEEKRFLSGSVPKPENRKDALQSIPVKAILTSMPVWAIVVSQIGSDWFYYFFTTVQPLYLKEVIKLSDWETNLLSGLPFIFILPAIYLAGYLSDKAVTTGTLSNTNMRKVNDFFCKIVPAAALLGLGFLPEGSVAWVFVLNTVAAMFMGFNYVSWLANPCDLGPAYTGFLVGLCEGAAMWVAVVIPVLVEAITTDKSRSQWQTTFYITGGLQVVTYIFYVIFASGELQPWAEASYDYDYDEIEGNSTTKGRGSTGWSDDVTSKRRSYSSHSVHSQSRQSKGASPAANYEPRPGFTSGRDKSSLALSQSMSEAGDEDDGVLPSKERSNSAIRGDPYDFEASLDLYSHRKPQKDTEF